MCWKCVSAEECCQFISFNKCWYRVKPDVRLEDSYRSIRYSDNPDVWYRPVYNRNWLKRTTVWSRIIGLSGQVVQYTGGLCCRFNLTIEYALEICSKSISDLESWFCFSTRWALKTGLTGNSWLLGGFDTGILVLLEVLHIESGHTAVSFTWNVNVILFICD